MNVSYPFDPDLHEAGSVAANGGCSHHAATIGESPAGCTGQAVVSFTDADGCWHSGCSVALEQLVESGQIAPLGQGA